MGPHGAVMKSLVFHILLATAPLAMAGRLDLAVIQFQGEKEPAEVSAALARVVLGEVTEGDKTRTGEAALRGGNVLFAQRLTVSPGAKFSTSTRLGNQRADAGGSLAAGTVKAEIALIEGVRAGLRNYQTRTYRGSAALAGGRAVLLSLVRRDVSAPSVVKGRAKLEKSSFTTILAAQYVP
jgi:hypothetical protein